MIFHGILLYMFFSISIGLWASRKTKTAQDYSMAGRSLPLGIVICTMCATWFGAEAILGIPQRFLKHGFAGTIEDPFGAALCLILIGIFFAKPWHKKNHLTISDLLKDRYGSTVEALSTIIVIFSYVGWLAAQILSAGIVFNITSHGDLSILQGMILGITTVIIYTALGGMYSIAIADTLQMCIMVCGLCFIMWTLSNEAGGLGHVIEVARQQNRLSLIQHYDFEGISHFLASLMVVGLGSIPQQDLYQRVMSAKTPAIAMWGSILGGIGYLAFCMVPIITIQAGSMIAPEVISAHLDTRGDLILPMIIINKIPVYAQLLFFGALLCAIMNTASATLLAPSVLCVNNIIKSHFYPNLTDKQCLFLYRLFTVLFGISVLPLTNKTIFELVISAYKLPMATIFWPLVAAIFYKKAHSLGALLSIALGGLSLCIGEIFFEDALMPPYMISLGISLLCVFLTPPLLSLAQQIRCRDLQRQSKEK